MSGVDKGVGVVWDVAEDLNTEEKVSASDSIMPTRSYQLADLHASSKP